MPRLSEITPLPPMDLRGLPTTDAYGNKVTLPETDSSGMPTLRGPMPGAAVPQQPKQAPAATPAAPIVGDPNSVQNLTRRAGEMERQRMADINATPPQLRGTQPMDYSTYREFTRGNVERMQQNPRQGTLRPDAQAAIDARQEALARGATPAEAGRAAQDAFRRQRSGQMPSMPVGGQSAPMSEIDGGLPFPEPVMVDYQDASRPAPKYQGETLPAMTREGEYTPSSSSGADLQLQTMMPNEFALDGTELSQAQPAVIRQDANGNQMSMGVDGQWHSVSQRGRATQMATSPGAVRGAADDIVGTEYGPRLRGTQGAMLRFVEDPMNPDGGALPVPAEYTDQGTYISNLSDQQRQNIKTMLIEQGGAIGRRLQSIEDARSGVAGGDEKWRGSRAAPQAMQTLQAEEDSILYGSMREPSGIIRNRAQRMAEQERIGAQQQRQTAAEQERLMQAQQRRNAQLWQKAQQQAIQELTDPTGYRPLDPNQVAQRTAYLYKASGGGASAQPAQGGMQAPQGGMAQPQSGAPDSMGMRPAPQRGPQEVAISPDSPVDFEQLPSGKLIAVIPPSIRGGRPTPMPAYNFEGRAVVVPSSPAEEDLLPPGTLFVKPGELAANKGRIYTKEGRVAGASEATQIPMQEEARLIEEAAGKRAKPRMESIQQYQEEAASYKRMEQDATARAVAAVNEKAGEPILTINPGTGGVVGFEGDAAKSYQSGAAQRFDLRGEFALEMQNAMKELAAEEYTDPKKSPSWIKRRGSEITTIEKPVPPAGYTEGQELMPTEEERAAARSEYFGKYGVEPEQVAAERVLLQAKDIYKPRMVDGKQQVTVSGVPMPAVRIAAGNVRATLPRPETPEQAMLLLRGGMPFATERNGRPMPAMGMRDDPRLKIAVAEQNKSIGSKMGAGQSNAGAVAAYDYVRDVFGYLGKAKYDQIYKQLLLGELKYQLTGT